MNPPPSPPILPWDQYNQRLVTEVRPLNWTNPSPKACYNLVVIGAGPAGLVVAAGAAALGAKVALIERQFMGGDCLVSGCVPSKALLQAAKAVAGARRLGNFGIELDGELKVDFGRIMERVRAVRSEMSAHDSAHRFSSLGVDLFFGEAQFVDERSVRIGNDILRFARAVIATGARATLPAVPGLEKAACLTNETLFSLTQLPSTLVVIGAGPVGCEMAQAFARLGSRVLVVETQHGVLPREDREAAAIVQKALEADGVRVLCCGEGVRVVQGASGIRVEAHSHGQSFEIDADQILVAAGRKPNTENLNLENAGVEREGGAVKVNDFLQTSNRRIYACGDVCSRNQFTHAADFMARAVIQNALFLNSVRAGSMIVPRAIYTDPELGQAGLTAHEAAANGVAIDTYTQEFGGVDRAVLEGSTEGFVKVHVSKGSDRILGATVVGESAGEMIGELVVAMKEGVGLKQLGSVIHPYPTRSEGVRKLGDLYGRTRLTPSIRSFLGAWLAITRR
jgi:pyruvate/2-oxoglutarate dehydrogenase complex dihydrolipoamide dehydrogenase (E3) component